MEESKELERDILEANWLYYNSPRETKITDTEFDHKVRRLKELNPSSQVLNEIGAPPQKDKTRHYSKMFSLDNAMDLEEADKFLQKFPYNDFVSSLKLDGASAEIVYKDGKFFQGTTRGDGLFGELSHQLAGILPSTIRDKELLVIHGEVVIPQESFKLHASEYSNPRNLAAGSLMTKDDPDILRKRGARFFAYNAIQDGNHFECYSHAIQYLEEIGISTVPYILSYSKDEVPDVFKYFYERRDEFDKECGPSDGVVVRVEAYKHAIEAGYSEKAPKFAMAWKFPQEAQEVIVNNIRWDVSKNGRLTPVAEFDPIGIEGAMISNCTLHNARMLNDGINKDSRISIIRSGGVIPKIMSVVEKRTPFFPLMCPVCNEPTSWDSNHVQLECTNPCCSSRVVDGIVDFLDKMEFKGLAEKSIEKLVSEGIIKEPAGLFSLVPTDLVNILGYREEHADEVLYELAELADNVPFERFLHALGIDMVGNRYSKLIAKHISPVNLLAEGDYIRQLIRPLFGDTTTDRIISSISYKRTMIANLLEKVTIKQKLESKVENVMNFVITGTLSRPRKDFEKAIEEKGHTFQKSITKETTYLVAGQNIGQNKTAKAYKYGTKIIEEEEFWSMLNNNGR